MLSIFRPWRRSPPIGAAIPDGLRIYAIGDVHGRADLFDRLLENIEADHRSRPNAECQLVFLGDIIDRGPESAAVVERALRLRERAPNTRFIMGNHEEMLLRVIAGDTEALPAFTHYGGRETILSYGISEDDFLALDDEALCLAMQSAVPTSHMAFLASFEGLIEIGDYAFVHAGIRPGVPIAEQAPRDTRWIRQDFLNHHAPYDRVIVHGHSISKDVEWRTNRIGIDTGAYASNKLTALGLEGCERWTLST